MGWDSLCEDRKRRHAVWDPCHPRLVLGEGMEDGLGGVGHADM